MTPKLVPALALLSLGLATVAVPPQPAHAQTAQVATKPVLTTLHRFDGKYGSGPATTLTMGTDGNFYGVTFDNATVFKMSPAGQLTTLARPSRYPLGALVQGADGAFYGTNEGDGISTAFRVTSDGQFQTLHTFTGKEGNTLHGALLPAPDGSFYGTAAQGGNQDNGTVFHMTPDGTVTILHTFTDTDGSLPSGVLVFGLDGALYGTTAGGGAHKAGVVFRVTTDGAYSVLHSFTVSDGANTYAGLTVGPDGGLYGVTFYGGIVSGGIGGAGVAYKITTAGVFTTLHKFSNDGHGIQPFSALTLGADGNFYGTTAGGGTNTRGTVFAMTPAGQVTTLYKFHTAFDGNYPYGGVVFGLDGALYGTTYRGGTKGGGTIYKLTLP